MIRSLKFAVAVLLFVGLTAKADDSDLIAAGAKVTKLAEGFTFTEGPAVDAAGNVYFSDIPNEKVHKWSLDGKLSTFREESGGANGLFFDAAGNLLGCEGKSRRVTSTSPAGEVTVLADSYIGKKLNSPNDLWPDGQGGIFFTDPRYGNEDGIEQDGFHVYYIALDNRAVTRIIDDLVKPNGIIGTADGKLLYVADPGDNKTYVYRLSAPGKPTNRRLFAESGSDGMTLDERGNLYLTRDAVNIYAPDGNQIGSISVPERPSNVCFGGPDRKTLFITARKGFYSVKMSVAGQ